MIWTCRATRTACKMLILGLFLGPLGVACASAATITNRGGNGLLVSVIEKSGRTDHELRAGQALKSVCIKGCVVRLNGDQDKEYELDGSEAVAIEDGYVYYDGPDTPQAAGAALSGVSKP